MCLVLTPLVLDITTHLRRNPVPYLLAVAMASNIGSVATITGNPQNMLIGSFSGIPYRDFAAALSPVAAVGLLVLIAMIALIYRREFLTAAPRVIIKPPPVRVHRALAWKSTIVSAGMIVFFFAGWPVSKVALVAGALLLVTRRVKPERVYAQIDWSLLVLFIGLFIIVRGVEKTSLSADLFAIASRLHLERPGVMSASGYPFHSAYPNRLYRRFGPFDHRVIGCRRRAHGLLHQPEEELASAFRPPAIEAKSEFIQVVRQMPRCHCALVRTQYPPFQERGNPVHARHQRGCLLPATPQSRDLPMVAFGLQARVALPAVGVNRAA